MLERAQEVGMKLAPKKCKFRLNQVSFVGHQFTNAVSSLTKLKLQLLKKCQHLMGQRHCINFLAWSIISTSLLATSVRRQRHFANCCGMTCTEVGSQHSNKLSTPSRQTSPNLQSWGTSIPQSLSRSLSMTQRVVLVLHTYRTVTLWPMPHKPWWRPKLDVRKSRRNCFLLHLQQEIPWFHLWSASYCREGGDTKGTEL